MMDRDLVKYFVDETGKKFDKLDERFNRVDQKLDLLFAFKWQIIGGSGVAGAVGTLGVLLFKAFVLK